MRRLIDANELESRLTYQAEVRKNNMNCFGALVIEEIISNDLATSPTVDAVEVVHGRWETVTQKTVSRLSKCTACGFEKYNIHWCNYCPNCGADMRGIE